MHGDSGPKGQKIGEKTFISKGLCRECAGKTFYAGRERAKAKVESEGTVRHAQKVCLGLQGGLRLSEVPGPRQKR